MVMESKKRQNFFVLAGYGECLKKNNVEMKAVQKTKLQNLRILRINFRLKSHFSLELA